MEHHQRLDHRVRMGTLSPRAYSDTGASFPVIRTCGGSPGLNLGANARIGVTLRVAGAISDTIAPAMSPFAAIYPSFK